MRNHAAAEIQRPARGVENHLHAGRVFELPAAADRRGQRAHHGRGIVLQQLDGQVDRRPGDLRLVALQVDDDLGVGHPPGDFGDAIGAAGRRRVGQFGLAAEGADLVEDFSAIGGHADARRPHGPPGGLVGVLDQGLARLPQQQLPRQPGRGQPGGNDDSADGHSLCIKPRPLVASLALIQAKFHTPMARPTVAAL